MAPKEFPPAAATSSGFHVVFFDGGEEISIGDVVIDASTVFKRFQLQISHKIGISPHQISLFLVRRKKGRFSPEIRTKTPIVEGCNFSAISNNERDGFILAVLKRSRRERRGRPRPRDGAGVLIEKNTDETPQKMLLRRPPPEFYERKAVEESAEERLGLGLWDIDSYMNLQRQRERYLISTSAASYYPYQPSSVDDTIPYNSGVGVGVGGGEKANTAAAVCVVCLALEEMPQPFHLCVYDAVTVGFRSNVGPVQRPSSKGHVEASGWRPFSWRSPF